MPFRMRAIALAPPIRKIKQITRGSTHRLNSYPGLVQLEEQQKNRCELSSALQLHIFCFHHFVTMKQADKSFVVAASNL